MEREQIEPELQGQIPRSIEIRKAGIIQSIGCLRVFLIPFLLVGLGTFFMALQGSIVALMGVTIPAQVTARNYHSDSDSSAYHIHYTYQRNGIKYYGSNQVSRDEYNRIHEGDHVSVKILSGFPKASPMLMTGGFFSSETQFMWPFTLIWNTIAFAFIWFAFIAPWIIKHLYISGEATVGKLIKKTITKGKNSDTYMLHYVFEVPAGQIHSKCAVAQGDWTDAQVDAKYTVLYDPKRPKRAVLYQFGPYRVI